MLDRRLRGVFQPCQSMAADKRRNSVATSGKLNYPLIKSASLARTSTANLINGEEFPSCDSVPSAKGRWAIPWVLVFPPFGRIIPDSVAVSEISAISVYDQARKFLQRQTS